MSKNARELIESMTEPAVHAAIERWLREEVLPGHAEYTAESSNGVPPAAVLDRIKARRAKGRP
jgi:hypothetical protein